MPSSFNFYVSCLESIQDKIFFPHKQEINDARSSQAAHDSIANANINIDNKVANIILICIEPSLYRVMLSPTTTLFPY